MTWAVLRGRAGPLLTRPFVFVRRPDSRHAETWPSRNPARVPAFVAAALCLVCALLQPAAAEADAGSGAAKAGGTAAVSAIARACEASADTGSLAEVEIAAALPAAPLGTDDADAIWDLLAGDDCRAFLTLPAVEALLRASVTPRTREAFWSELGGLAKDHADGRQPAARAGSLLGFAERHREALRPLYAGIRDTESSGDEMVDLMQSTGVFGSDLEQGLAWLSEHNAAAIARRLERERGRGKPVKWEKAAFQHLLSWKETRLVPGARRAAGSLADLDADGETYVVIFNSLHDFDKSYRQTMLRGLGPVEVFNAVVGGELELYRMGTSSYRDFMHAVVMGGIRESGSLEAFLERAAPKAFGDGAARIAAGRGMVLLRVVSSFGLLEDVLETVAERGRFIADALASLGDPETFEGNASVMLDLLTLRSAAPAAQAFRHALLDHLYERHGGETNPRLRKVYGSVLSVYQTVTGDRREAAIDRELPLDDGIFRIPFARLFSREGGGSHVHRMFMRFDEDVDAKTTHASFRTMMRLRRASVRQERHYVVYRLAARRRVIEIWANDPTAAGLQHGIAGIAAALGGKRVETVIGRGHTAIVTPLQRNARRILGDRVKEVATVLIGTCGGDAAVRDLIATFGYIPFFTTRSTGRQTLNNALVKTYIDALMGLSPGGRLDLADVLDRTTVPFLRKGADPELRDDAAFYRLSMTSVLAARLFDTHVRPEMKDAVRVVRR